MVTSTGRERPWRAVAFQPDWTAPAGRKRQVVGRTAAKTRAGLDRFIRDHEARGHVVDVTVNEPLNYDHDQETENHVG